MQLYMWHVTILDIVLMKLTSISEFYSSHCMSQQHLSTVLWTRSSLTVFWSKAQCWYRTFTAV